MKTQPSSPFAALFGLVFVLSHAPGMNASAALPETAPLPIPVVARFENFTEKDGLPAHKIHCVLKAGDGRLWLGTTTGLASGRTTAQSAASGSRTG